MLSSWELLYKFVVLVNEIFVSIFNQSIFYIYLFISIQCIIFLLCFVSYKYLDHTLLSTTVEQSQNMKNQNSSVLGNFRY